MTNNRILSPLLLIALFCGSTLADEATMKITIPRATLAPTLDGKIAPAEWDDATAVTGIINQFDGFAHPRQATFWLKYDDTNLYVAQRSTLLPGEKNAVPVMPNLYFKDNQNAVVIALAPNRVNSGESPSHYRFMSNISSTVPVRRELFEKVKGVNYVSISSPVEHVPNLPNTATVFNTFSADETIWESETVIPLAEMKVEKAPIGEEWGILLARDYPQLDQNAIVQTTSYRFDWVMRDWRNLTTTNAYHLDKEYARAQFAENGPVVQVLELGDLLGGHVKGKVAFFNSGAQETSVTAIVSVGSKTVQQTIKLPPGERMEWVTEEIAVPDNLPQTLNVSVNDAAGKSLYRQSVPIRPGYAHDRTAFVPDLWFAGEPKMCASAEVALPIYNPIRNTLFVMLNTTGRTDNKQPVRVEVTVRRPGEDKPFATFPMTNRAHRAPEIYELDAKLPDLEPGVYEATASLYALDDKPRDTGASVADAANLVLSKPSGDKLLARSRDLFIRYDHAKDLPWIGTKIGVSDKVLPPWTPIVTKETQSGQDLSCWGRTYEIDGSGLPTQIKTLDENILSAPIHLEMVRDGKPVALTPAPRLTDVKTAGHEVDYKGSLTGDGWKISTSAHLEYDGYLLYRIRLEPQGAGQSVDSLKFVIPLTNDQGRYMHAASCNNGEMRAMVTTQALKPEKGPLWDSSQQAPNNPIYNGHGLTIGNFKSYVWVGGAERGIAFLADSDKDWVPDDTKKVSSSEVVRTESGVNLVLNLVSRPFTFDRAREITFSLQATPVRPLPDDFRQARLQLSMGTAFCGYDVNGWGPNSAIQSVPFPIDWEKNRAYIQEQEKTGKTVVTQYQAMDAFFVQPEFDDPRSPGLKGANWYGYLQPEITAHRDVYDAAMTKTEVEYRIWRYQRWIKENGLHGFYFDNSFTGFSANPASGLGYVIDLPDRPALHGQIQPGFAWTGMRDMLKRLRTVIVEEGHRPYLWIHATDTFVIGAYSFADCLLDGETLPFITPTNPWFSEKWSPERMQAINDSSRWGVPIDMLEEMNEFTGPNDVGQWRLSFRDVSGYMLLHDNEGASYHYLDWNGLDLNRKVDFLPYWDPPVAAALRTGNEKVLASAWRQDGALRVVVFNRSSDTQENLNLAIDPKALGLATEKAKSWLVTDVQANAVKPVKANDDPYIKWPGEVGAITSRDDGGKIIVTLKILPHDYRLLRVE